MLKLVKCPKCGFENPEIAKFCINCGFKLIKEETQTLTADPFIKLLKIKPTFEGFFYIFLTSYIYTLTNIFSKTIWSLFVLLAPSILCLILGFLIILRLKQNLTNMKTWIIALTYAILGLIPSVFLLYVGIDISEYYLTAGVIIFLVTSMKIILDRVKFS